MNESQKDTERALAPPSPAPAVPAGHEAVDAALIEVMAQEIAGIEKWNIKAIDDSGLESWRDIFRARARATLAALSRHGLAIVPAESAGAARDMRENARRTIDLMISEAPHGTPGPGRDALIAARDAIAALPLPTALPDMRDEAMRLALEFAERELECREQSFLGADGTADDADGARYVSETREVLAALTSALSPSNPQEPGK